MWTIEKIPFPNSGTKKKSPKYFCEICRKSFKTQNSLTVHQRLHQSPQDLPYSCRFCQQKFNQITQLQNHEWQHTHENCLNCDKCGVSSKNSSHFYRHAKKHQDAGAFECPTCQEKFSDFDDLQQHKKLHLQKDLHKCAQCLKGFRYGYQLKRHQIIHSNVKPHECKTCHKRFADISNLHRHEKLHLQVKKKPPEPSETSETDFSDNLSVESGYRFEAVKDKFAQLYRQKFSGELDDNDDYLLVVKGDENYKTAEVEEISSRLKGLEREFDLRDAQRRAVMDDSVPID